MKMKIDEFELAYHRDIPKDNKHIFQYRFKFTENEIKFIIIATNMYAGGKRDISSIYDGFIVTRQSYQYLRIEFLKKILNNKYLISDDLTAQGNKLRIAILKKISK